MTTAPTQGIFTIPASLYHCDDIDDQPSLSASIASILCAQSPAHAKAAHPRLNPNLIREDKKIFDVGSAAHALILEGRDAVELIHHGDYRSNAAKEDRDNARAAGKIPLLAADADCLYEMCEAVVAQLPDFPFTDGKAEQTLVWDDEGVMCRARLDWLRDDYTAITDLKTTSRSANPKLYERNLFKVGGDVQCAMYVRAVEKITGVTPTFRWVIVETAPPYALSVVEPGPDVLAVGAAKVAHAIRTWRECLETDTWPAYGSTVHVAEAPPWETHWLITEELEEAAWAQM